MRPSSRHHVHSLHRISRRSIRLSAPLASARAAHRSCPPSLTNDLSDDSRSVSWSAVVTSVADVRLEHRASGCVRDWNEMEGCGGGRWQVVWLRDPISSSAGTNAAWSSKHTQRLQPSVTSSLASQLIAWRFVSRRWWMSLGAAYSPTSPGSQSVKMHPSSTAGNIAIPDSYIARSDQISFSCLRLFAVTRADTRCGCLISVENGWMSMCRRCTNEQPFYAEIAWVVLILSQHLSLSYVLMSALDK